MKVAIIVQRYGNEIIGGSEQLARNVAETMASDWNITVLTTCAKDYHTWQNVYNPGPEQLNKIKILRFPTEKERDFSSFAATSFSTERRAFCMNEAEERQYFVNQGPFCPQLVQYLRDHKNDYDVFIFFTYLYYPTVFGVPEVADKAYLVATAHDEPPFYFIKTYAPLFHSLKGFIFLSDAEQKLVNSVYELPQHIKQIRGGYGVPEPHQFTKQELNEYWQKYQELKNTIFYLFLGRATPAKRPIDLVDAFTCCKVDYDIPAKLVFAGEVDNDVKWEANRSDILVYNYITEKEKSFLLQSACALINPSSQESLSMVVLEAWANETLPIVNGHSQVMIEHCNKSEGGIYYYSLTMLSAELAWAAKNQELRKTLAKRGKYYVLHNFNWQRVRETLLAEVK